MPTTRNSSRPVLDLIIRVIGIESRTRANFSAGKHLVTTLGKDKVAVIDDINSLLHERATTEVNSFSDDSFSATQLFTADYVNAALLPIVQSVKTPHFDELRGKLQEFSITLSRWDECNSQILKVFTAPLRDGFVSHHLDVLEEIERKTLQIKK